MYLLILLALVCVGVFFIVRFFRNRKNSKYYYDSQFDKIYSRIVIEPVLGEDEEFLEATIPALGKKAYIGCGDTPEHALEHLAMVTHDLLEMERKISQ